MGEYREGVHAPPHLFIPDSLYMITAGTYLAERIFNTDSKLFKFVETLEDRSHKLSWELIAWVALPNHYHFIGRAPSDPSTLIDLIRSVHSITAKYVNAVDNRPGRRVWHNYWDTCIKTQKGLLSRIKYIHLNQIRHGLVDDPLEYPFSCYSKFSNKTSKVLRKQFRIKWLIN
jgi:putative transposase